MKKIRPFVGATLALALAAFTAAADSGPRWVGTWATSPQLAEPKDRPPVPGLADATLRQIVHVSLGGKKIRVHFSNEFGHAPVTVTSAHIAVSAGGRALKPETDRALTFSGAPSVTIPSGAPMLSDEIDFDLAPLANVAITIHLKDAPAEITSHPGSRTTSYFQTGGNAAATELTGAVTTDHWYFISGLDVLANESAAAVAILGDSITDGRGSTTNGNDRWPDQLALRLHSDPATANIGVLNHGIGGNRLLRDGIGPNALARFDRDVLAQSGVRWLIVLEGVNDLGTAVGARARGEPAATPADLIAAFEQIVARAHAHDLRVFGATIMPFEGFAAYSNPASEADRQTVNHWIRTSGNFDAVIDFDAATRDPEKPSRLSKAADGGDHLHPGTGGYKLMADAIDLALFKQ